MDTKPTVIEALAAVMAEVQAVGKTGRNTEQGYNFRGVDAVVNAVGPVLRKHGVIVLPELEDATLRDVRTSRNKPARESTVKVRYRFYGPAGDSVEAVVPGESMDTGDKGMAKAMSVAYRILWLQALCIPTDEPDPDTQSYERAYEPAVTHQDAIDLFAVVMDARDVDALRLAYEAVVAAGKERRISDREAQQLIAHITNRKAEFDRAGEPADSPGAEAGPVLDLTDTTRKRIFAAFRAVGMGDDTDQHVFLAETLGPEVRSFKTLTEAQGRLLVAALEGRKRTPAGAS